MRYFNNDGEVVEEEDDSFCYYECRFLTLMMMMITMIMMTIIMVMKIIMSAGFHTDHDDGFDVYDVNYNDSDM